MQENSSLRAAYQRLAAGSVGLAEPYYLAGLRDHPAETNSWLSWAAGLANREQLAAAAVCARRAVALAPDDVNALKNLGSILWRLERYTEAEPWLEKAYTVSQSWSVALDLALCKYALGNIAVSEQLFAAAITAAPDDTTRRLLCTHMAYAVLASGDWRRGLALYDHRYMELPTTQAWELGAPLWQGEDLTGKHLLVHHDQGDGDTIQFARFLPKLAETAASVTLAAPPQLLPLFSRFWPNIRIRSLYGDLEVPDFHSPIGSYIRFVGCELPAWSGPYIANVPYDYLIPKTEALLRIGLVWAARPTHDAARRAVPLEQLLDLAEIPGVALYGLQVGEGAKDIARLGADALVEDLSRQIRDWRDTAGIMAQLDMVVSVDSAPLHLAGAMGLPVIGLLPFRPCWRWGFETNETAWYPTMRLLRQAQPGDWTHPLDDLHRLIAREIEHRNSTAPGPSDPYPFQNHRTMARVIAEEKSNGPDLSVPG
jgi:tetratricopeptide (TPR) repeat protein